VAVALPAAGVGQEHGVAGGGQPFGDGTARTDKQGS
jgi:hypothetical protein